MIREDKEEDLSQYAITSKDHQELVAASSWAQLTLLKPRPQCLKDSVADIQRWETTHQCGLTWIEFPPSNSLYSWYLIQSTHIPLFPDFHQIDF